MPTVPTSDTFSPRPGPSRVPIYERSTTTPALPGPRLTAQYSSRGAEAIGQGLQDIGAAIIKVKRQADDLRAVSAANDLTVAETALLHDPEKGALNKRGSEAFGVVEPTLAEFDKRVSEISDGLANDQQRALFQRAAMGQRATIDNQLQQHVSREFQKFSDTETQSFVNNELDAAIAGYQDPARIEAAFVRINGALAIQAKNAGLGNEWLTAKRHDAWSTLHAGVVQQFLTADRPDLAQQYFESNQSEIDVTRSLALSNTLRARAQEDAAIAARDEAQLMAKEASDLELSVRSGKGDPAVLAQQIDNAFAGRAITGPKRTELHLELQQAQKKAEKDNQLAAAVNYSLQTGVPLDYKDKEQAAAVDRSYRALLGGASPFAPASLSATALLVKNTGIVPETVRSMVRSLARSGQPQHAVMASDLVARLNEAAPQALETIPADERAFALMVSQSVAAGMDAPTAVETARARVYEASPEELEKLKAVYDAKDFKTGNAKALNSFIDKNFDAFFRAQPEAPPALAGEFENLTRGYFIKTHDPEQARTLAWRDLLRVWGLTDINGQGLQLMKYAPEKLYGNGQPNSWMRQQLEDEVRQIQEPQPRNVSRGTVGGEPAGPASQEPNPLAVKVDPKAVRLVADDITARSSRPTYALLHQRADSLFEPVLDRFNRPARWAPDFSKTPEGRKQAEEQAALVERSRETRQNLPRKMKAIEQGLVIGTGLGR